MLLFMYPTARGGTNPRAAVSGPSASVAGSTRLGLPTAGRRDGLGCGSLKKTCQSARRRGLDVRRSDSEAERRRVAYTGTMRCCSNGSSRGGYSCSCICYCYGSAFSVCVCVFIVCVCVCVCVCSINLQKACADYPSDQPKRTDMSSGEGVEDMSSGWFVPWTPISRGRPQSLYICKALP
ncbi:hypothetical protein EDC01DRAFT_137456 [Geopyxis carbonaria]|nr:hypothetical protein EDC01DRAFT_137456 [Geopyxis carbonaria]